MCSSEYILAEYISFSNPQLKIYKHVDIPCTLFPSLARDMKRLKEKVLLVLYQLLEKIGFLPQIHQWLKSKMREYLKFQLRRRVKMIVNLYIQLNMHKLIGSVNTWNNGKSYLKDAWPMTADLHIRYELRYNMFPFSLI
ncbi:hypothetical protein P3S68_024250 [Capsicum galapagoense]